jgi:hypothetical protein
MAKFSMQHQGIIPLANRQRQRSGDLQPERARKDGLQYDTLLSTRVHALPTRGLRNVSGREIAL